VTGLGINCTRDGGDCTETYPRGTEVVLTASPYGPFDRFPDTIWGNDCGLPLFDQGPTCTLIMDTDRLGSIRFAEEDLTTINLVIAGSGSGSVRVERTNSVASRKSTGDCPATDPCEFTLRTFGAWTFSDQAPDSGSHSVGWSGDCFGFSSCTISRSQSGGGTYVRNVTINFNLDTLLDVATSGTGSGRVTGHKGPITLWLDPGATFGIDCPRLF
jgi:hypothetical protein